MLSNEQIAQLNAAGFAHPSQLTPEQMANAHAAGCERLATNFRRAGREDHADHWQRKARAARKAGSEGRFPAYPAA